ncbi:hypothetical protein EW145_g4355 [Phellinidium pouzarii]|uniref:Magnesium transporter n=1 Tax=Phellinidium pouzarii TaxID=167371 RepID=A0A4S4L416_9AGAM|nr:hypothetical protein EW145_g4355 [Phellinidium pouzarii]
MSSASASSSSSAAASATTSAAATITVGSNLKIVGIVLAIVSGVLIGSSFVFKKKGLLRAQAGGVAGEGVAYLKSPLWWLGMTMMILGELCNFAAYAFVEALVVTPLGALSVVICAILSSIFLNEKLTFFGYVGCALCILGSVVIALNGPQESSVGQIKEFEKLFISPGFLSYAGVLIVAALIIIFYFAPRYGKKSMLWYIMVCSMIGGISVSVTTGLGSAIVTTASGDNQFKFWFIYFLMVFVVVTLITEVYYLNVALALFNTAMVTPTYYVICLKTTASQIITVVMGFLVICCGITILQMSKIDPTEFGNKLDRRSTMLLQAARSNTTKVDEKDITGLEDPGMDSIRGSFGPLGSMIRARSARRMSMSTKSGGSVRSQHGQGNDSQFEGFQRHQLYDAPVPSFSVNEADGGSVFGNSGHSYLPPRHSTIKFGTEDVVHKYPTKGLGTDLATHERREVSYRSLSPGNISLNSVTPISEEQLRGSMDDLLLQQPRPQHAVKSPLAMSVSLSDSDSGPLRTAPATLFASQKSLPQQDPFAESPATAVGSGFSGGASTLPLPSRSRFNDVNEPQRTRGREHAPTDRRYPKGVDDREESISLVHSPEPDDDTNGSDEDLSQHGGIRLVGPSPGRF